MKDFFLFIKVVIVACIATAVLIITSGLTAELIRYFEIPRETAGTIMMCLIGAGFLYSLYTMTIERELHRYEEVLSIIGIAFIPLWGIMVAFCL